VVRVNEDNKGVAVKVKRQVVGSFPTEYQYVKSILIESGRLPNNVFAGERGIF
jgi:hypothetical protein